MNRAIKIRIYPDKEQRIQIEKTIGCSRFIYNQMLADKISYYQKEKKMLRNTPAGYKKEYQCSKWEYPFAGYPFEASKDVCRKNKTSPPDPVRLETEIGNDKP